MWVHWQVSRHRNPVAILALHIHWCCHRLKFVSRHAGWCALSIDQKALTKLHLRDAIETTYTGLQFLLALRVIAGGARQAFSRHVAPWKSAVHWQRLGAMHFPLLAHAGVHVAKNIQIHVFMLLVINYFKYNYVDIQESQLRYYTLHFSLSIVCSHIPHLRLLLLSGTWISARKLPCKVEVCI